MNVWKTYFGFRKSLWLVLSSVFVLLGAFSLRAAAPEPVRDTVDVRTSDFKVFFPFDSDVLRSDYMGNDVTLASLDSALRAAGLDSFDSLRIAGSSSPEGNYDYNIDLAYRRSASLKRFLAGKYPVIADKIVLAKGTVPLSATRPEYRKSRFAALRIMLPSELFLGGGSSAAQASGKAASLRDGQSLSEWSYWVARYGESAGKGSAAGTGAAAGESAKIMFPEGEDGIDPGYMGNHRAIALIDNMIAQYGAENIDSLIVFIPAAGAKGVSAKDGKSIDERHAAAVVDYIKSRHPELADKIIVREAEAASKNGIDLRIFGLAGAETSGNELAAGRIVFPADGDSVASDYMENSAAIAALEGAIARYGAENIDSLVVFVPAAGAKDGKGVSAGDGKNIDERRAAAFADYIKSRHPELADKIIVREAEADSQAAGAANVSGNKTDSKNGIDFRIFGLAGAKTSDSKTGAESGSKTGSEGVSGGDGAGKSGNELAAGRIMFPAESDKVDRDYMDNSAVIAELEREIARYGAENIDSLVVIAPIPADGSDENAKELEARRAKAVADYMKSKHPELADKIRVREAKADSKSDGKNVGTECRLFGIDRQSGSKTGSEGVSGTEESGKTGTEGKSGSKSGDEYAAGRIMFPAESDKVDRDYMDNSAVIAELEREIARYGAENIDSLVVIAPVPADGSDENAKELEARRAKAVADYMKSKHPELADKIRVREAKADSKSDDKNVGTECRLFGIDRQSGSKTGSEGVFGAEGSDKAGADDKSGSKTGSKASRAGKSVSEWSYSAARYGEDVADRASDEKDGDQDAPASGRLLFPEDEADIDQAFMGNHYAVELMDSTIARYGVDNIDSLVIMVPVSDDDSPEQKELNERRAASVADHIKSKHPELADRIRFSESKTDKSSTGDKDARKDGIDFSVFGHNEPEPEVEETEPVVAPEFEDSEIQDENIDINDEFSVSRDTTQIAPIDIKYPIVALSTNLLGGLAVVTGPIHFTPNIAAEWPIGKKWSFLAEYTFPWWVSRDNSRAWQILKWDLGARWWFTNRSDGRPIDVLKGHFLGVDLSAGYYDIEPKHKGYQGEFQLAGLEYGYAWALSDCWRFEAYVGAGWMGTHYRYYVGDSTDQHLLYHSHGKLYWFGPTKAGISIKYIFNHTRRYVK